MMRAEPPAPPRPLQSGACRTSILLILMGSLGDVARGLCLVSHIKRHRPAARVTWLIEPACAELAGLHPGIDQVIVFQRSWRPQALRQLAAELRRRHFDVTLDLQRLFKSGFFSLLSGARRRIGFHPRNAKELNWLFNNEHIPFFSDEIPKIRHYLKFCDPIGLPQPQQLEFGLAHIRTADVGPEEIRAWRRPFVALVLGSAWQSKDWTEGGYQGLIARILEHGSLGVVLLGDRSRTGLARRLAQRFRSARLFALAGKTTLTQLVATLQAAAAAVGPDSGPGHLAAAVGTPFVTLFGPTSPRRTAPFGCEHLVVKAEIDCAPCYRRTCPKPNRRCMHAVTVGAVVEKLSQALAGRGIAL
jgi:lipopolysaccharide heptosyltransferase I